MAVPVGGGYLSSLVAVPLLWIGAVVSLIVGSVAPVQLVGDSISINTLGVGNGRSATLGGCRASGWSTGSIILEIEDEVSP